MARGERLAVARQVAGIGYTHLGIDLGDGTVVHAQPDDPARLLSGGAVVRTSLAEFAAGAAPTTVVEPEARFPAEEIARRAEAAVGRPGYCPVGDNCEHFVTWCATGSHDSRQAAILLERAAGAAARLAALAMVRLAVPTGRSVAVRTALGATARIAARSALPAVIAAEGAALAAEWTAHQRGADEDRARWAGEMAGLATSAGVCALAAAAAGPAAVVAAAVGGAALWGGGSAALVALDGLRRGSGHGHGRQ
ncbi:MAG: lecithin retinol acyltransferase family protein [Planctomycetota bacterium]